MIPEEEYENELVELVSKAQERYKELTEQIEEEKRKLEYEVPGEPEDRVAVEQTIERLEEERRRISEGGPL
ncbi:hypothetical protein ACFO4L_09495 [Bacillus daqingensis]|uniref:Uncharacterized protein n=2 Tax=Bacillaceae TaxID=186817 RepID=A0A969PNJ7_9BACI|nr:hypothetical protein [Alkalicoccus luteus]NJP36089.1 hypothetical protein [Alkalicoccus luteus]